MARTTTRYWATVLALLGGVAPVAASPVDLTVTWASSFPTDVPLGGPLSVFAVVKAGGDPVPDCVVGFYLSPDATITKSDILVASASTGLLYANANPQGLSVTLDPAIAGQYYVGAIVDIGNVVSETDETNNALAGNLVQIGPDHSAPIITVSGATDGLVTTALPLTICYVAEDANLASVAGTLDGVTFYGCTTAYFTGAHDLVVTASDWAGNAATTRLTFTIAGGPLAVAAITPSEGAVVAGQADVLVAVSSALGVETVVANGVTLVEEAAGYYHGVVMLTEGPNAIQVLAHDTAGNAASVVLNVISDTTPPSLTVTSPADGALVGDFLVAGSVSDATAVTVTVNSPCGPNGLCRRPISVGPTGQFSTTISPPAGPYDIAVVATDAAGNVSPTIVRHVTSCPTGAACGGKATCRCSASYACVVDPGFMTLCYDGAGNMTARLLNAAGQPCSALQSCP